jgi:hypothetical protein
MPLIILAAVVLISGYYMYKYLVKEDLPPQIPYDMPSDEAVLQAKVDYLTDMITEYEQDNVNTNRNYVDLETSYEELLVKYNIAFNSVVDDFDDHTDLHNEIAILKERLTSAADLLDALRVDLVSNDNRIASLYLDLEMRDDEMYLTPEGELVEFRDLYRVGNLND